MSHFDNFVGTREVSDSHRFDVDALQTWLLSHMPGFVGPLQVEMFKGGQSNPTYKLITPAKSYVMRAKPGPVAKLLPSAHAIEREFAVMRGLNGTDVPVAHCTCCAKTNRSLAALFMSWNLSKDGCCGTKPCPT